MGVEVSGRDMTAARPARVGRTGQVSRRPAHEPVQSSVRRNWSSTVWMVGLTLAISVISYSHSLKVASERSAAEKVRKQTVALEGELKALNAELRVRMRMPQLQRWNDNVLGLIPISATQYLEDPVRLANYGEPIGSELPQARLAVRDVLQVPQADARPQLVSAPLPPSQDTTRAVVRAASQPTLARPEIVIEQAGPRAVAQALPPETRDLLRDMEVTFAASDATN